MFINKKRDDAIKTRGSAVGMSRRECIIVTEITGHFLYADMED